MERKNPNMKRSALIFSILFLFAMAGCSYTNDPASVPDSGTTPQTQAPTETETTVSEETTAAASEIEAETTKASETTAASETASETESEATQTTDIVEETQMTETEPFSISADDLIGKWQFPDGYCLNFLAGGVLELSIDFSYDLQFNESTVQYLEKNYPFHVEGNTVTATGSAGTILEMTAMEGADAENLTGRFRLGMCQIYIDQVIDHTEQTKTYYLDLNGSKTYLIMPSEYKAEEGVLTMVDEGSEMLFDFKISGDILTITDQDGYKDILSRIG